MAKNITQLFGIKTIVDTEGSYFFMEEIVPVQHLMNCIVLSAVQEAITAQKRLIIFHH